MTSGGINMGMTPPHPGAFIRIEALEELGLSVSAGILQRVHDATVKACSGYSTDDGNSRLPGYSPLSIFGNFEKVPDIADAVLEIGSKVHGAVQTWFGKTTVTLTAKCRDSK